MSRPFQAGESDLGSYSSNPQGYMIDLDFDYPDLLDRSKKFKIHIREISINFENIE